MNPHEIIGSKTGLKKVLEEILLVAKADVPVLLIGETGTGKEVIARAVHAQSKRAEHSFVRVNCASIPGALIDSELFGHEKGSFTGAVETRHGWFEQANGGTLLLDEIGEMTPDAQARLLRVLQDGEMYRVGGKRLIKVDVRIVAATHRDLRAMVDAGEFREDLYYRICSFPVHIPPLRDRLEDIIELTHFFVERASRKFGLSTPPVSPYDVDLLAGYSWPGNVRELITVVERAVILGHGQMLTQAAMGMSSSGSRAETRYGEIVSDARKFLNYKDAVRKHLVEALRLSSGRVDGPSGAAKLLGLNPNTLRSKLRRYNVCSRVYRSMELR